jgi:hypothetical protein
MARSAPLTVIKDGINRLRTKGGARADSLYDLLNGYVTESKTVKVRPGTLRVAVLPPETKGLVSFAGALHVFASQQVEVPAGYILHLLVHPDSDGDTVVALERIHFAKPFMGFLYVVAEFEDGAVYHYWLQTGGAWEANKVYRHGDIVEPTTPNGLAYQATRLSSPLPSWAPGVPRQPGDQVEPTEYNDFFYTVVDVIGANPISGDVEPDWPEEDGARIFEDTEGFTDTTPTTTEPPTTQQPTSSVQDRYNL